MNLGLVARTRFLCVLTFMLSLAPVATAQGPVAEAPLQSGGTPSSLPTPALADDGWHVGITPYLWFAGVHGTVGALGRQTGVHVSFGDILSNLNIGLMGEIEARKKRVLVTTDVMWMRLSGFPVLAFRANLGAQPLTGGRCFSIAELGRRPRWRQDTYSPVAEGDGDDSG
jgi:hypothetical protein